MVLGTEPLLRIPVECVVFSLVVRYSRVLSRQATMLARHQHLAPRLSTAFPSLMRLLPVSSFSLQVSTVDEGVLTCISPLVYNHVLKRFR